MIHYYDFPKIPTHLIPDKKVLSEIENEFSGSTNRYCWYESQDRYPELETWLKSVLPFNFIFAFHTLTEGVKIHKDISRTLCYNYIFEAGGESVTTDFYTDDGELIQSALIPENTWHTLQVDIFHGVSNIKGMRYALTVTPEEYQIKDPANYNYSVLNK